MSTEQWKPGTVARVDAYPERGVLGVRGSDGWFLVFGDDSSYFREDGQGSLSTEVRNVRPLVVLDLDSELLADLRRVARVQEPVFDSISQSVWGRIFSQIREQTQPPRPEEPSEFGAKVTATAPRQEGGRKHVRLLRVSTRVPYAWADESGEYHPWSELSDVTLGWDDEGSGT